MEAPQVAELYRLYAGRVYARCLYLLRDPEEARDAMQDVFIKVHRSVGQFRAEASPLTWITHITTNHCFNVLRSKRAPWRERYRQEVANMPSTMSHTDLREQRQLLRICLDYVAGNDPTLAALATHYFVDDMSQQQICALCDLSAPTLRKRLRSFLSLSQEALRQAMPGIQLAEVSL
jgi:RNA polymerase sigma factor (sigma-70 family)